MISSCLSFLLQSRLFPLYFQPLWGPISGLPDPPSFPNWLSHNNVQILTEVVIEEFLRLHPSEIWAQIINFADSQLGYFELMAPWYSGHSHRLYYMAMHLFISCLALCRSKNDPDFQPGTTFMDTRTPCIHQISLYCMLICQCRHRLPILFWFHRAACFGCSPICKLFCQGYDGID